MNRKLFAAAMFAVACGVTLYASSSAEAVDEAPAPRAVEDKKPDGKGKFDGFRKGGFGGKFDPEKLKEFKGKFGGKFDPEKFKGKFGGKLDPEKLKEFKEKFGKGGFGKKKEDKEE